MEPIRDSQTPGPDRTANQRLRSARPEGWALDKAAITASEQLPDVNISRGTLGTYETNFPEEKWDHWKIAAVAKAYGRDVWELSALAAERIESERRRLSLVVSEPGPETALSTPWYSGGDGEHALTSSLDPLAA